LRSVAPRIWLALQTQRSSSHYAALSAKVREDAEADWSGPPNDGLALGLELDQHLGLKGVVRMV
jgi:hypothetical protein